MLAWGMGVVAEVLEIVVAIAVLVKWVVNSRWGHLASIVALVVILVGFVMWSSIWQWTALLMLWVSGAFVGWWIRGIRCTQTESDGSSSEVCTQTESDGNISEVFLGEYADSRTSLKWKVYVKILVKEKARVVREDGQESGGVINEHGQLEITFQSGRTHTGDLGVSGCIPWSNGTRWMRVGSPACAEGVAG